MGQSAPERMYFNILWENDTETKSLNIQFLSFVGLWNILEQQKLGEKRSKKREARSEIMSLILDYAGYHIPYQIPVGFFLTYFWRTAITFHFVIFLFRRFMNVGHHHATSILRNTRF